LGADLVFLGERRFVDVFLLLADFVLRTGVFLVLGERRLMVILLGGALRAFFSLRTRASMETLRGVAVLDFVVLDLVCII
tara:strand:+ start:7439 stop:7678 length:240 start_codon:yes stop_codon:yes gene_type:complete